MLEFAAWGRTAMSGWSRRRGGESRLIQQWRVLVAALSRAGNTDPALHLSTSELVTGVQAESMRLASDPRSQAAALYEQHARAVLGYLCSRLPTLDDAEDALAEVFLAALTQCATGQTPGIGWLLAVARRRAADFYRHRRAAQSYTAVMSVALVASEEAPEDVALRAEAVREALGLIAALPDEQRDALALRFAAGLRAPQIAAILGKSDEATRALLSRALRRLRKELAQ
jgi:RNA polymerase sigma factor (sigma-70 family)